MKITRGRERTKKIKSNALLFSAEGDIAVARQGMVAALNFIGLCHPSLHPRRPHVHFQPPWTARPRIVARPWICAFAHHLHNRSRKKDRYLRCAPARAYLQRRPVDDCARDPEDSSMGHNGEPTHHKHNQVKDRNSPVTIRCH